MPHNARRPSRSSARDGFAIVPTFASAAVALSLIVTLGACRGATPDAEVAVVGEKIGVLVWHPVANADQYEVEVIAPEDSVIHYATTADTVSPLPPTFAPVTGTQWTVRALRNGRVIARSTRHPIY